MVTLNSTWLESFVTLCEIGHFTRAARALHMTQPGLTQQVKKLEAQVGAALLSRDGKSFMLTPAGEAVLSLGRERRTQERQLLADLGRDAFDEGDVRVAMSGSLALLLYPVFIEAMAASARLNLGLEAAPQARVVAGVVDGAFDLGILDRPPAHPRLEGVEIGRDQLCLILPAGASPYPDWDDLEALGFIAHPDGYAYADALLGRNFAGGYRGSDRLRLRSFINQVSQIAEPVAHGLGYTILPRTGIDAFANRNRLSIAELAEPVHHALWLVHRKGRVLPARVRHAGSLIEKTLAPPAP